MKKQRGYTLFELIIGIGFLVVIGLGLGSLYVAIHFIGKFW